MRSLGFNVAKGTLRFVVLEGTRDAPTYVEHGALPVGADLDMPASMAWFADRFAEILDRTRPDRVAFRLHHSRMMSQEQVAVFHYPWGVLAMQCGRRALALVEIGSAALTAKRFGLEKGLKPMTECDARIGTHPPKWDDMQRYAACTAWAVLD